VTVPELLSRGSRVPMDKDSALHGSSFALIMVVLIGVYLDPYTLHHDATDVIMPGPWWQSALGFVDLSLLSASLGMVRWRRYAGALALLGSETLWAIGSALILVNRDGMGRFVRGFGAEPYLAEYLIVMGLRIVAMICLWQAIRRAASIIADRAA
jgi:hypothetical protein